MPALAWIDDDHKLRDSFVTTIRGSVPKTWRVLSVDPLSSADDYSDWIAKNDVAVLILDERLADKAKRGKTPVNYHGHDVVSAVRKKRPEFPVFMITGWEQDVDSKKGELEDIISKSAIRDDAARNAYMQRIIRAGMRYYEARQAEINEMSTLAEKVALGNATKKDKNRLRALQSGLTIAAVPLVEEKRSDMLNELEKKLDALDQLTVKFKKALRESNKGKSK